MIPSEAGGKASPEMFVRLSPGGEIEKEARVYGKEQQNRIGH